MRPYRITVCELPHEQDLLLDSWDGLCSYASRQQPDLVLLPEFAFVEPLWEDETFDPARWIEAVRQAEQWHARLTDLQARFAVGARPVTEGGKSFNEGFLWSNKEGLRCLRRKFFLPDEPGGWEARWFARGDPHFPRFTAGELSFGLNICTELWALETYSSYAALGVQAILSPRATAATTAEKWLSIGRVAAVRSGAFCVSSNRVHPDGSCGGRGWIIDPDGTVLAQTSELDPWITLEIDLDAAAKARSTYPRYVFPAGGMS